jgi:bleomycin hydrolase
MCPYSAHMFVQLHRKIPPSHAEELKNNVRIASLSLNNAQTDLAEQIKHDQVHDALANEHKLIPVKTIQSWLPSKELDALSMVLHSAPLRVVDQDFEQVSILKARNFNLVLPGNVCPSNQMYSGRCWMFAGLNMLRRTLIVRCQLRPDFELSQSYLFFWHYFEQYNDMLNLFFYDKDISSMEKSDLLQKPLHDGGNWITFKRLSRKYGVVPKSAYRESWPSSHSSEMNQILCHLLQNDICHCHGISDAQAFIEFRDTRLRNVLHILCSCMGTPPMDAYSCVLDTTTKKRLKLEGTPLSLLEMTDAFVNIEQHVQVIHDPRAGDRTWHTTEHQSLQNTPELFFNVTDMQQISNAVTASIASGRGVWFACNMNEDVSPELQGMALGLYRPDKFLPPGNDLTMTKMNRMEWGRAHCNHAMLIVGVETDDDGHAKAFEIENSWGAKGPGKGYYKMTLEWFHEHVYTVVLHRDVLTHVGILLPERPPDVQVYPYSDLFG